MDTFLGSHGPVSFYLPGPLFFGFSSKSGFFVILIPTDLKRKYTDTGNYSRKVYFRGQKNWFSNIIIGVLPPFLRKPIFTPRGHLSRPRRTPKLQAKVRTKNQKNGWEKAKQISDIRPFSDPFLGFFVDFLTLFLESLADPPKTMTGPHFLVHF